MLSQRWPRNAPHGWPENFRDSLNTTTAICPKTFHGLLFQLTLWICIQNLKSVALPAPELIWGSQKIRSGAVPDYAHTLFPHKILYAYHAARLFMYVHLFSWFSIVVSSGVANLQSREKGGHRGSGMVPFERALVSSYRPSIVSSIFTRFRDIAAFVLQNATYSLPHL